MAVATKNRIAELAETNGAAKEARSISLQPLQKRIGQFVIHGISPLIVHKFSDKAQKEITDKAEGKSKVQKAKEDISEKEIMRDCLYVDDDGDYCFPSSAIKLAMVSAATSLGDPRRFGKAKIRQAMFVLGTHIKIVGPAPQIRIDPARNPNTGGAVVLHRPMFSNWKMTFEIEYNASVYSSDQLANLLELAGFAVGLGDWRPEKSGNMGRFSLIKPKT